LIVQYNSATLAKNMRAVADGYMNSLEIASQIASLPEFKSRSIMMGLKSVLLLNLIGMAIGDVIRYGKLRLESATEEEVLNAISMEFESVLTTYIRNNLNRVPPQCQDWYMNTLQMRSHSLNQELNYLRTLGQQNNPVIQPSTALARQQNAQTVTCEYCHQEGVLVPQKRTSHKNGNTQVKYFMTIRHKGGKANGNASYHAINEISREEFEERRSTRHMINEQTWKQRLEQKQSEQEPDEPKPAPVANNNATKTMVCPKCNKEGMLTVNRDLQDGKMYYYEKVRHKDDTRATGYSHHMVRAITKEEYESRASVASKTARVKHDNN